MMKQGWTFLLVGIFLLLSSNVSAQQVGTIGVGDLRYSAPATDLRPKENILSAIDSGLNSALLKTRKFTVLDYQQLTKRLSQQQLSLEDYYQKKIDTTKLQQAGLDYILTADITEVGLFEQERGDGVNATGLVEIDFRLLGVADLTNDFESSVSAQVSQRVSTDDAEASQEILDAALQRAVDQVVDQLIATLFPLRVMKISETDQSITLNYGEGLLKAGDTVLVFPLGEDITLDENGEAIGESIATLQIISAERKFATAQALEGFVALRKGQKGQLLKSGG